MLFRSSKQVKSTKIKISSTYKKGTKQKSIGISKELFRNCKKIKCNVKNKTGCQTNLKPIGEKNIINTRKSKSNQLKRTKYLIACE